MRLFTIILATSVLFLALKPGMDLISLHIDFEESCCSSQCAPLADFDSFQDQIPEDGCDGNGCNPFQVCCSNVMFLVTTPLDLSTNPQITTKQNFTYQSAYNLLITFDFWQPPQFV
jgi:hypothetical protein